MKIPQSQILTTRYLNRVFDKTVATYKYYWFLSILDLYVKQGKTRMNVWEIMITMVANAWYPVNYFRLSFGKSKPTVSVRLPWRTKQGALTRFPSFIRMATKELVE